MVYVEFPTDPIVNVHWKKKPNGNGPPGPDFEWPCGAFKHGYGLYDERTNDPRYYTIPGNSIFILEDFNIYGIAYDHTPMHNPNKPYNYWWSTADYLIGGTGAIDPKEVPFVWGRPRGWTLTVDFDELKRRYERDQDVFQMDSVSIQEFRNLNIQALNPWGFHPPAPDREVVGRTIEILPQQPSEIYPPGFRVMQTVSVIGGTFGGSEAAAYPPTLVQAHCKEETEGDYPPGRTVNQFYLYPAPGYDYWPIRPPPPPPYE